MIYTEGAWNWHLQLGVGEFPRSTGSATEKCFAMYEGRWGEWKSYEISLKSYPPWNYHIPWKRIVGRWSLLSGWSIFKGYISFRECTACGAIGNPRIPEFLDSLRIWNAQFGPMGNWQHRGWINQHISSHGFPTHHIIESSAVNTTLRHPVKNAKSARSGRNSQALVKIYSDGVLWQDAELPQSNVFFSRWRCWKDTQTSKTLRESYLVTPASWMEWMWDTATDGK